ncbi:MAG: P-loop NTPase [Planctomycetes bacterium]|nr:P-loop NTPase [Planctomycetota bacterium]
MAKEMNTDQINEEQKVQMQAEQEQIKQNMKHIKHQILVLSGKGGVGKSSIAVNLAVWLSMQGKKVGLLDVDIHGPSIPKLLNLEGRKLQGRENKIEPIVYSDTLKVMSIGFMIQDENAALIWRGPMKHHVIKQFVSEVSWGDLDYLIVDCPPGTGDEPLSIVQLLGKADGAVVVTTPQQLAVTDVKKCLTFCKQLNLPVLGVIENMAGFVCSHCNQRTDIFGGDGGKQMAKEFNVPFLGSIPIDPNMVAAADLGKPFIYYNKQSPTAQTINYVFEPLLQSDKQIETHNQENKMKIAIPLAQGKLTLHFGHCEQFAIIDINEETKEIAGREDLTPPAHEPGVLPQWLHEQNVNVIIAGGMGQRAQQLFTQNDIKVVVGASSSTPEELVLAYLQDTLQTGDNICDH